MTHELPELGYKYDALEPYIDAKTMEIHHTKHHQAYIDKLNAAVKGTQWESVPIRKLLEQLDSLPENIRTIVRNNGGGHYNHSMFWDLLKKNVEFKGELIDAITKKWGSFEDFKKEFSAAAMNRFGSGWAWLVLNGKELEIMSTPNQDSPVMEGKHPVIGLDVWEHAYYLKYQNKRSDYVEAFFQIINWEQANHNYKSGMK